MKIYLVRHGETVWNKELRYQGHTDIHLSELGIEQSRALAGRIAQLAGPGTPIFTSDLKRAHQSASAISEATGASVTTLTGLREAFFGAWEGMSFDEIARSYPQEWEQWRKDPAAAEVPGAEDRNTFKQRVLAATEKITQLVAEAPVMTSNDGGSPSQSQAVVVTHGGVIKTIIANALGLGFDSYWKIRVDNCSLSIIDIYDQGSILSNLNDTSHLTGSKAPKSGSKVL